MAKRFSDSTSSSQLLGALIALLVAGFVVRAIWHGGIEDAFSLGARAENQIEAGLREEPGNALVLKAIEQHFPLEYDDLLESMANVGLDGANEEQIIAAGNAALTRFLAGHKNDFAYAPTDALTSVLESEQALIARLDEENPLACSAYVFGTAPPRTEPSAEVNLLVGEAIATKVRAMAAGRADQQLRLPPTPREFEALLDAMRSRGASEQELNWIRQGANDATSDLDVNGLCATAKTMVTAIGDLETFERDQMIGALLAIRG